MNKISSLALFGGGKTIQKEFTKYNAIGKEEKNAAIEVIDSGVLSQFVGEKDENFLGGPKVRQFEADCAKFFKVKHAVTVNSWTSGLVAAIGAIGIEPGDEIIVTPWTMVASATAILNWNAIPVFADIDPNTFNLDPQSIKKCISNQTKAIMVVDIFGQSADMDEIMEIARNHDLKVISDCAQSPSAIYKNKYAGTLADVGGYSLNYHKHIHTGEGGVLVTNNDNIARKLRLIRNHAEAVVDDSSKQDLSNMIGQNFRLGEIECAIGIEQLKKLKTRAKQMQRLAGKLSEGLSLLKGLTVPTVKADRDHVYYTYGMKLDIDKLGVSRDKICAALGAEGVSLSQGYCNVHMIPMYQNKIAYGSDGFPWSADICKREVSYAKGICPVAEELHDKTFFSFSIIAHDLSLNDIDLIVKAFKKVWINLEELK